MIKRDFKVSIYNLAILMQNMQYAEERDLDANMSHDDLIKNMNESVWADAIIIEKALACCKLRYEKNTFMHPEGLTFEAFLAKVKPGNWKYDKEYNLLEKRSKKV